MRKSRPTFFAQLRRSPAVAALTFAAFVLGSVPHTARADDDAPAPQGPDAAGGGAGGLGAPDTGGGASAGDLASVDPSTGDLHISYPFELPVARGRLQPSLALQYSSTAGDSDAGFGWSLSLPSIERKGWGNTPDPLYNDPPAESISSVAEMDHMFFGSTPLVPVCEFGDATCSFKSIAPGGSNDGLLATGWYYFRAQVEQGPSTAFLWAPDRQSWLVVQQDGSWMEFGKNTATGVDGAEHETLRDGRTGVFRWHLTRKYDAHRTAKGNPSNPIVYVWANNGINGLELSDIYDTPTDPDNATASFDGYAHHTRLNYGPLPYPHFVAARWRATPSRLLTGVDVTSQDLGGSARAMVRRYHLAYDTTSLTTAWHPNHSQLSTITLEGRCTSSSANVALAGNTEVNGALGATSCKSAPPTTFTYTLGLPIPGTPTTLGGLSSLPHDLPAPTSYCSQLSIGGCDPLATPWGGCPKDSLPTKYCQNGLCECEQVNNLPINALKALSILDFDGDGLADLLYGTVLCRNKGNDAFDCSNRVLPPNGLPAGYSLIPGDKGVFTGDFLGDGRLNLLSYGPEPDPEAGDQVQPFSVFSPGGPISGGYLWLDALDRAWNYTPIPVPTGGKYIAERLQNVADVNGDGLTDLLVYRSMAPSVGDRPAPLGYTAYGAALTQRYASGVIVPFGRNQVLTRIPTHAVDLKGVFRSGQPIWSKLHDDAFNRDVQRAAAGKKPGKSAPYELVDMNGDGLVDVVAVVPTPSLTGAPTGPEAVRYWPGYGDGTFGTNVQCTPTVVPETTKPFVVCSAAPSILDDGGVTMSGTAAIPAAFDPAEAKATFHDLNGDGLADLVIATRDGVNVWVNLGGAKFDTTPWISLKAADLGDMWLTDTARLQFADVDGSGTDDMVFADKTMGYVDPLFQKQKPGLLVKAENGVGATTYVQYQTMTQLDSAASPAWKTHSPQNNHVVTSITTTNGLAAPSTVNRTVTYGYRDPIFEPRARQFRGFEVVTATQAADWTSPGTTTRTTFLTGQCPHAPSSPCPPSTDNPWEALRGLPSVTEVDDASGKWYSTSHTRYQVRQVAAGTAGDGRKVRLVYPEQSETFLADPTAPPSALASFSVNDVTAIATGDQALGATPRTLQIPSIIGMEHLSSAVALDDWGRTTTSWDYGRTGDDTLVTQKTYYTPPGALLGLVSKVRTTNVGKADAQGNLIDGGRTKTFDYDASGGLTDVTVTLSGSVALSRAGNVPVPPSASATAAHAVKTVHIDRDPVYGGVTHKTRPDGGDETFVLDPQWHQFATSRTVQTGTAATGYGSLTSSSSYDIGLGRNIATWDAAGAASSATYDGLNRPISLSAPNPLLPTVAGETTQIQYLDVSGGVRRVHVRSAVASTSAGTTWRDGWSYIDGLGATLATVTQADPSAGDRGTWSVGGMKLWSAGGRLFAFYVARFWSGDPTKGEMPTPAPGLSSVFYQFDALGRVTLTSGLNFQPISKTVYHALSTETWDAEDLAAGGPHAGTPTIVTYDGHHRPLTTTETSLKPTPSSVTTSFEYLPTGELTKLTRTFDRGASSTVTGKGTYVRTMAYDTMGRLVQNVEPNTSTTLAGGLVKAWSYAYDDAGHMVATADARGCGENIYYDLADREIAEDYVPCSADQAAYTAPDLATGAGTEAYYRYDAPEAGQTADVAPALWHGRLASVSDRAEHSRFGYDGRGHVVRTSRQLAKPDAGSATLDARYATQWFVRTAAFDYGNRVTTESTGAVAPELLVNGKTSTVTTEYTGRGFVKDVTSDYGMLVSGLVYDEDGSVKKRVLGDLAQTTSAFTYGYYEGKLLMHSTISRGVQAIWSAPPPTYTASSQPAILADTSFAYDHVGNPLSITETASTYDAWAAGAKPVSKTMTYDDRYRVTSAAYDSHADTFNDPTSGRAPVTSSSTRVASQTFEYDGVGNTTKTTDDASTFFDRSLGVIDNGAANQLTAAGSAAAGGTLSAAYDAAGNMTSVVVNRSKGCFAQPCARVSYTYAWDEVGRLASATRDGTVHRYTYDASGARVLTSRVVGKDTVYNAEIFPSLRLNGAKFLGTDYEDTALTEAVYLVAGGASLARVLYSTNDLPSLTSGKRHVFFEIGDMLGSTSFVIDQETSEVVERRTYQAYGGLESEYQPARWKGFREEYGFTGKEADLEVGLTYFGARYYSAELGRFISADPLAIHDLGADLNPYAYVGGQVASHTDPTGLADDPKPPPSNDGGAPPGGISNPPPVQDKKECATADPNICSGSTVTETTATPPAPPPPPPPPQPTGFMEDARGYAQFIADSARVALMLATIQHESAAQRRESLARLGVITILSLGAAGPEAASEGVGMLASDVAAAGATSSTLSSVGSGAALVAGAAVAATARSAAAVKAVVMMAVKAAKEAGGDSDAGGGRGRGRTDPMTNKQAREAASDLGFNEVRDSPVKSHGQLVFQQGNRYISPDIDVHSGGTWKMFDRLGNRTGTFNGDLSVRIGD